MAQKTAYDVVVYSGTSGDFTAAIQVARMGRTVVLLEPTGHVGGRNVEGLGGTDIDNHPEFENSPAVGGLALEFYRRIARAYGTPGAGDHRLQAYCFRLCLTQDSANRLLIMQPAGYDRSQYEIYERYERAANFTARWLTCPTAKLIWGHGREE